MTQSHSIYGFEKFVNFYGLRSKFKDDVILIIVDSFIEFNLNTSPICINSQLRGEDAIVSPGLKGHMGVWSQQVSATEASPNFKVGELLVTAREECKNDSTEKQNDFFTSEKFCAKKLSPEGASCRTNSGNGLVFPVQNNGKIEYFLRGVATKSTANITCASNNYVSFTNVAYFMSDIIETIAKYHPNETFPNTVFDKSAKSISNECRISEIPPNGFASHLGGVVSATSQSAVRLEIGQMVRNFQALRYGCDKNYLLKGKRTNICLNGAWANILPVCSMNLGELYFKFSFKYIKISKRSELPVWLACARRLVDTNTG